MAIVQAYKCSYTNKIFEISDKDRYVKHLKKIAKTKFPLDKAIRYAKKFDLNDFRNSITSLEHFNYLLSRNFVKYLSIVIADSDFKVFSRYANMFNLAFNESEDSNVLDKCDLRILTNNNDFFISRQNSNYSYLGINIYCLLNIKFEYKELLSFGTDFFKKIGMSTHGGSVSTNNNIAHFGYEMSLNAMDWKFVANMAIRDYVTKQVELHTDFVTDVTWHKFYTILVDTHWPGKLSHLQSGLNLLASLGAGEYEVDAFLNQVFDTGSQLNYDCTNALPDMDTV